MIVTATVSIVTDREIVPFLSSQPALLLGAASKKWKFAFNCDEPRGIKLLSAETYRRLETLQGSSKEPPNAPALAATEDHALYYHGLIKLRNSYSEWHRPSVAKTSLNVWLHVTNGCNLGCFYCYIPGLQKHVDGSEANPLTMLGSKTSDLIIKELVAYCQGHNLQKLHVKFGGGEPTLAIKQIDEFCTKLRSKSPALQVSFGILTNGVFNAADVVSVLHRHNFKVSISIDGAPQRHDSIRYLRQGGRRYGTWDIIRGNISLLREAGLRPYFLYTITKKNLADLREFASFADADTSGFRLSLERANKSIPLDYQRQVAQELARFYTDFSRLASISLRFDRDAQFSEWSLDRKKYIACSTCRGYLAISNRGTIASCQMRLDEPMGDLHSTSLTEIVQNLSKSPRTALLSSPEKKLGACTRCAYRFTCSGGCPQHTHNVYNEFDRPSPWCFVYGTLLPVYVEACATHLARRVDHIEMRMVNQRNVDRLHTESKDAILSL